MRMLNTMAAAALALAGGFGSGHHRGQSRRIFPRISQGPDDTDRADPANLKGHDRQAVLDAQAKRVRKAAKLRRDYGRSLIRQNPDAQDHENGRPAWAQRALDHLQANSGGA